MTTEETEIRKAVFRQWELGEPTEIRLLTSGFANMNFRISTETGRYLYRLCLQQNTESLQYEIRLMQKLRALNFPTAFPIPLPNGSFTAKGDRAKVMLYDFVPGREPEVSPATAAEIGRAAAKLNCLDFSGIERENALGFPASERLTGLFPGAKNPLPEVFDFFRQETAVLQNAFDRDLPTGPVHGDLFPDNTLFSGEKLAAIIDFEEACTDSFLFEIGVALNGFGVKNNRLDLASATAFLDAYSAGRPLEKVEIELLPFAFRRGAQAMLAWHLENQLIHRHDDRQHARVMELKNRIEVFKASDFRFKFKAGKCVISAGKNL